MMIAERKQGRGEKMKRVVGDEGIEESALGEGSGDMEGSE